MNKIVQKINCPNQDKKKRKNESQGCRSIVQIQKDEAV
jgi:hypothetical protein